MRSPTRSGSTSALIAADASTAAPNSSGGVRNEEYSSSYELPS